MCADCVEEFCGRCAEMHLQIKQFRTHSLHPLPHFNEQSEDCGMYGREVEGVINKGGGNVRLLLYKWYQKCNLMYESILQRLDASSSYLQLIGFIFLCVILRLLLGRKAILVNVALAFLFYRVLARRSSKSGPYLKRLSHLQEDATASLQGTLNTQEEREEFWHYKEGRNACLRSRGRSFKRRKKKEVFEDENDCLSPPL